MVLTTLAISAGIGLAITAAIKSLIWLYQVKNEHLPRLLDTAQAIHTLKDNHLPHLQTAIEETRDSVRALAPAIEHQTSIIVNELREQRADLRVLTSKRE